MNPIPDSNRIMDGVKNVSIDMPAVWSGAVASDELAKEENKAYANFSIFQNLINLRHNGTSHHCQRTESFIV